MLVKLNTPRCGNTVDKSGRVTGVFGQIPGEEVELEDAEARRYIERGHATEVKKNQQNRS